MQATCGIPRLGGHLRAARGGDHGSGHRCAGEWLTIAVVERAVRLLTTAMTCDVPLQDLSIDLSRMPAAPASGVRLTRVRSAG